MEQDPEHGNAQYDYAYDNAELESDNERKIKVLKTIKDVVAHTATQVAYAGVNMGQHTRMPDFNTRLNMHNGFETPNPLGSPHPTVKRGRITRGPPPPPRRQ